MNARAQDKRTWLVGGAAVAALIALVGWFFVIHPKMSSAASVRTETESVQMQNVVLTSKIAKLRVQNAKVHELTAALQGAIAALPFDTGLPELTRQLARQAAKNHVSLDSINIAAATAVAGVPAAAPTSTGAPAAAPTSTGAPAATGATTSSTLLSVPITLLSSGKGVDQQAFLRAIQVEGPRRALVTSSQLTPTAGGKSIAGQSTMNLQLNVFTATLSAPAQAQLKKLLRGDVSG